ncbi:MAG: arylsulfatase [Lachnospiraceae bacterium]|nr:arylsulfatase [Lachnospiraceae bacterium]
MSRKGKFIGTIGRTVKDTEFRYEELPEKRRADAPNVVYIVLDDLGFAQLGCYGSSIDTPNIDRLAKGGLRYNNFHTTAICSATRASLLTGANHHSVGCCATIEMMTGCPNGAGELDKSYATLAEILKEYDYDTFACGKWHLTSWGALNPAGPYDSWPLGRGFDRYYGFLHAMINQFNPILVQDNTFVEQPKSVAEGYHISEDITDHAIDYICTQKNSRPEKPFFLYLAYGAMHAPHHAPKAYIDKYKGRFDEGWDVLRDRWFANQKKLGIIPQDAELNPRNRCVPAWDSLSDEQKKVNARYMEAYAGMLEHTDVQIGRLVDYLEKIGELENTMIVFLSDNGASPEGGPEGRLNMNNACNIISTSDETEEALQKLDLIGGEYTLNHYPVGWANLGNTPFQWYKTWVHSGGVKDPMIVCYPKEIKDKGGIREQYHHVIDITPTVLDVIGVRKPDHIKGISQKPIQGISFRYTFDQADAKEQRTVQYYEMLGNRGIYKDGWKAITNHTFHDTFDEDEWELYHVSEDYSERHDVAGQYPDKLKELQEEWFIQAGRYNVFPQHLNSHVGGPEALKKLVGGRLAIPEQVKEYRHIFKQYTIGEFLNTTNNSYVLQVTFTRTDTVQGGVLFSEGDRFGGWSFYIKGNHLYYTLNKDGKIQHTFRLNEKLAAGRVTAVLQVRVNEDQSAVISITAGGNQKETLEVTDYRNTHGNSYSAIGANPCVSVSTEYSSPFVFEGEIEYVKLRTAATSKSSKELLDKFFAVD